MSLLVVYNACGALGKENSPSYIRNIQSILMQGLQDVKIVFSGCMISPETFKAVYSAFGNVISYCLTDDRLAVNQSFNNAVRQAVKEYGKFDGYMYVASDVTFDWDPNSLSRLHERILQPDIGIVSPEIDKDNGYFWWMDFEEGKNLFDDVYGREKDFVVPLGSTANLHAAIFSNEIYEAYGNVLPDVFVSYCTESTFTFLAAAVRQKFIIANDVTYSHGEVVVPSFDNRIVHQGLDGQSLAFGAAWDRIYPGARPIKDILEDPEAKACGFGHEEWVPKHIHKNVPQDKAYLVHDPEQFDKNSLSKDGRLKEFIAKNLFLGTEVLDYDTIKSKFIKGS